MIMCYKVIKYRVKICSFIKLNLNYNNKINQVIFIKKKHFIIKMSVNSLMLDNVEEDKTGLQPQPMRFTV